MQDPKVFIDETGTSGQARHVIPNAPMVTVGSDSSNHIAVQGEGIVSLHAVIMRDGNALVLCDQGAPGGTFVNGLPITEHELHEGDVVEIGNLKLRFGNEAAVQHSPPPSPDTLEPQPPPSLPSAAESVEAPPPDDRRPLRVLVAAVVIATLSGFGFLAWHLGNRTTKVEAPAGAESEPAAKSDPASVAVAEPANATSPKAEANTAPMPTAPPTPSPTPPPSPPKTEEKPPAATPPVANAPSEPLPLSVRVWNLISQSGTAGGPLMQLPSADGRLSKLDQTIENAAMQSAFTTWQGSMTELQAHYRQALERELRATISRPGQDASVAALRVEINQIKSASTFATIPTDAPESLKKLRTTYLLEAARLAKIRESALGDLYDGYCNGLTRYASDLNRDGQADMAAAINVLKRAIQQGRIPPQQSSIPTPPSSDEPLALAAKIKGTRWTTEDASGKPQGTIEFSEDSARADSGIRGLWTMTGPRTIQWQDHEFVFDETFRSFTGWWAVPSEKRSGRRMSAGPLNQ